MNIDQPKQRPAKFGGQEKLSVLLIVDDPPDDVPSADLLKQWVAAHEPGRTKLQCVTRGGMRSDQLLQWFEHPERPTSVRPNGAGSLDESCSNCEQSLDDTIDVVAYSSDVELRDDVWQRRTDGSLMRVPANWETSWGAQEKECLIRMFAPCAELTPAEITDHLSRVKSFVQQRFGAHLVVLNCSTVDPDDSTHNYHGVPDTKAVRVHKLNYALWKLSMLEGVSIVDVDRLVAEIGGKENVPSILNHSPFARETIWSEFARILSDIGFFENRPLVPQLGQKAAGHAS